MDQIAIPNFKSGAMENWGLVTYREPYLLYNETINTFNDELNVVTTIAHEFGHMWFGDLVKINLNHFLSYILIICTLFLYLNIFIGFAKMVDISMAK